MGVIADMMTLFQDLLVDVRMLYNVFPYTEKGRFRFIFTQLFQYKGVATGCGPSSNVRYTDGLAGVKFQVQFLYSAFSSPGVFVR